IVHGNSRAEDFSDPGFAYLGELLASRGFIVASIDENFLNTNLIDSAGGLTGVNAARGWLLLEHLRVWHAWNNESGNPFHNRIDTANIALIGHSRGGEAVAVAAAFNTLERFPDDPNVVFDYGYAIRSIIAIAPSDAQYVPLGEKLALQNINYLVLQGSHDADVFSFVGLNQYHRTTFSPETDWIKAAVYIYRANHGHFNSTWDAYDLGEGLSARLIDTAALLPAEEQRKAAQVFVAAFLETTLHSAATYRPFFRDVHVGRAWQPDTVYISQYADATTNYLSTYEEDVSVTSATLTGGTQLGAGLIQWQEEHLLLRGGPGDDRVVRLGWQPNTGPEAPRYTITLPAEGITRDAGSVLRFDMADLVSRADSQLTNLTIEVRDADGTSARLPLSHVAPLQPPIEGRYLKSAFFHDTPLSDPIPQTFSFPLGDFAAANPAFDPATLTSIAFVFDGTPAGTILLDNVGVAAGE
ncbi:MAG: MFS transporter, partial [Chloroflexi bacterium]|nr:MFS transporter [Chloroflexota bacterium]